MSVLQTSLPGQQPQLLLYHCPRARAWKLDPSLWSSLGFSTLVGSAPFPTTCSGNSSYSQSTTGNDPSCFVPLGQSKYALVWGAFLYQTLAWPGFSECWQLRSKSVGNKQAQHPWALQPGMWETVAPQLGTRRTMEPHSIPRGISWSL